MHSFFRDSWFVMLTTVMITTVAPCLSEAEIIVYNVNLNGANEAPPNASPGSGSGSVSFDTTLNVMTININFSGLLGNTTAAHIHAATASPFTGTAGVATTTPSFAGFPTGVTNGSFSNTLDLTLASTFNAAYLTANGGTTASASSALMNAAASGRAYFNLHSTSFPGGEIRGFLTVPEPSSFVLIGLIAGIGLFSRRTSRERGSLLV